MVIPENKIKSNFESNARDIRYTFFDKIDNDNNYDFFLTAHHKMDQVETVIMKTVKNSNWISKIGVREYNGKIRRPLLSINKGDISDYAQTNNINFLNDPSNKDYYILRNNIRLVLEKLNSKEVENYYINLSNSLLVNYNNLIRRLDDSKIVKRNLHIEIDKSFFLSIDDEIKKILINREVKAKYNVDIIKSRFFWNELFKIVLNAQPGKKIFLSKKIYINIDRNSFNIASKEEIPPNRIELDKDKNWNNYSFKIYKNSRKMCNYSSKINYLVISNDLFKEGIYVRSRKDGDKIKLNHSMTKKIKNIFIDNKISNIEKNFIPIVTDSKNNVIWVPGYARSKFAANNTKTDNIMIKYIK